MRDVGGKDKWRASVGSERTAREISGYLAPNRTCLVSYGYIPGTWMSLASSLVSNRAGTGRIFLASFKYAEIIMV